MTTEQIKRCAERCVDAITHCTSTDEEAAAITRVIAECVAEAKQQQDDAKWFRDFTKDFPENIYYMPRILRIADRLERDGGE